MGRVVVDGTNTIYEGDGTGKLELDAVKCFHLCELHLDDSNLDDLYLTDNFYDISWNSTTAPSTGGATKLYKASGNLLSFSPVSETTELRINTIQISLSGVDNSSEGIITDVLNYPIVNKRVVIHRSFGVDSTTDYTQTFLLFDGNIKNFSITEGPENSTITLSVATHWANFEQKNGRVTNTTTQKNTTRYGTGTQPKFTGDKGFEYASSMIADIKWGPHS
tara:strand:- start:2748 stop:3410 length:663 start_codon:yes stop_codon:yes gene_type:complete